jgi:pimeloyl-ACP methyl ester carboxylesterase/DNA-binding winged helix-turn-helix (wHTH) protein
MLPGFQNPMISSSETGDFSTGEESRARPSNARVDGRPVRATRFSDSSMIVGFGDCQLDVKRRELRLGSNPVHVEPQVFDLLAHLIAKRDRVVTMDEILEAVWHGRIVSEATLSSRINAVRQAIGDTGKTQAMIRTVARRGFRFVGEVRSLSDDGASSPDAGQPPTPADPGAGQEVTFCTTADRVRLAVGIAGKGEVLVKTANWLNHIEYDWRSPVWAPTFGRLAAGHQLVRYDARGTGLSDWDAVDISFDAFVRDLETIVDALGLERFALFGISQGGSVAIAYAARHPERVSKLIVHGAFALGRNKRRSVAEDEQALAFLTLIRHGWGYPNSAFMQAFSSLYLPDATSEQVKWFADLQRMTASPENAMRIRQACDQIDLVDMLPKVKVPTLVTHNRGDNVVPFQQARLIASSIPGARFIELDSRNHPILPGTPGWARFMSEAELFLAAPSAVQPPSGNTSDRP